MAASPRVAAFVLAVCLATAGAVAHGRDVFRWVDDAGVVHFSDTPPAAGAPDLAVTTVALPDREPAPAAPATAAAPGGALPEAARARPSSGGADGGTRQVAASTAARYDGGWRSFAAPMVPAPAASRYQARRAVRGAQHLGLRSVFFAPVLVPRPLAAPPNALAVQQRALEEAGLAGPRPSSINSRAHAERVARSRSLNEIAARLSAPAQDPR